MWKYLVQVFFYMQLIGSQRELERCVETYTSTVGQCRRVSDCQSVRDDFQINNIQPTFCSSRTDADPVVCCREGSSILQAATRPSWGQSASSNINGQRPAGGKRISELMCQNYSRAVTQNIDYISLLVEPEVLSVPIAKCNYDNTALVIGGQDAELGEFPHMVTLGWPLRSGGFAMKCGGSLISRRFILTAGHCASTGRDTSASSDEPTIVRLGDHNLNQDVFDGASPMEVPIRRIIKHPSYKPPLRYDDIALVEMSSDVDFRSDIRPACLWSKSTPTTKAVATGWGVVDAKTNRASDILQKVSLDFIDVSRCDRLLGKLRNRLWRSGFSSGQICAGVLSGGHDTCQGDSGGPLQVVSHDNQCIFHVVGVTSFGGACGARNQPAVYTRVAQYLDWIESIVWPQGSE